MFGLRDLKRSVYNIQKQSMYYMHIIKYKTDNVLRLSYQLSFISCNNAIGELHCETGAVPMTPHRWILIVDAKSRRFTITVNNNYF